MTSEPLLPTPRAHESGNYQKSGDRKIQTLTGAIKDGRSISSPEASHASLFPPQDEGSVRKMIATSGRRCFESYESFIRGGSSVKMLAASLLGAEVWYSNKSTLTWKAKVTKSKRLLFQLYPSTHRTEETGYGLLRTPNTGAGPRGTRSDEGMSRGHQLELADQIRLLPTPRGVDGDKGSRSAAGHAKERTRRKNGEDLPTRLAFLPTPTSRDYKDTGDMTNVPENALLGRRLGKSHGLKLQPAFALWMMGYETDWLDLGAGEMPLSKAQAMRLSRKSQQK